MSQQTITRQTGFAQLSDLPCLKLQYADASAVVSLYGGQVLSYQPSPGKELLWLSSKAQWHHGAAIRGGVPVCWPWFGPASSKINPQQQPLPNHGLVRNRLWQVKHSDGSAAATSVTLSVDVNDLPAAIWPAVTANGQKVSLNLTIMLNSKMLGIHLSCDRPLYQQAALHSYFRVSDVTQSRVKGLSRHYFDKVNNSKQHSASSELCFNAETDRIYYNTASELYLADNTQQLTIKQQGHDASVIWNPWQQKSRDLTDMAYDGFNEFVCVESASLSLDSSHTVQLQQTLIPA